MKSISYFAFFLSLAFFATNCTYDHLEPEVTAEELGGYYNRPLTLTNWNTGTDYIITKDLDLLENVLTIHPGTTIEVADNVAINIHGGSIQSKGEANNNITIKGMTSNGYSSWAGIKIFSNDTANTLTYTVVENAGIMLGTDYNESGNLSLRHVWIKNCECGIYQYQGAVDMDDSVVFENVEKNICD